MSGVMAGEPCPGGLGATSNLMSLVMRQMPVAFGSLKLAQLKGHG